jgi:hypothetical protein
MFQNDRTNTTREIKPINMKVVCIDNINDSYQVTHLTTDKVYDAINLRDGNISLNNEITTIQVTDDTGKKRFYRWDRFRRLDDVRQDKINELIC